MCSQRMGSVRVPIGDGHSEKGKLFQVPHAAVRNLYNCTVVQLYSTRI